MKKEIAPASENFYDEGELTEISENVRLAEGPRVIKQLLLGLYFSDRVSVKEAARKISLPLPVVTAIKNELKKRGIVATQNGMALTAAGREFAENHLGCGGLEAELYTQLMKLSLESTSIFFESLGLGGDSENHLIEHNFSKAIENSKGLGNALAVEAIAKLYTKLTDVFENRPTVDVTIDQSKATLDTSIRRALLCLKSGGFIGSRILCLGDDDFVSLCLGWLAKLLFPKGGATQVTVVDTDQRICSFISDYAQSHGLPVDVINHNLSDPLPHPINADCVFTDPPYTLPGLTLFLSRGVDSLKRYGGGVMSEQQVFLSFGNKPPLFKLDMQRVFLEHGLNLTEIKNAFNCYEGAEIIGNLSHMYVLSTTTKSRAVITEAFAEPIYTGQLKKTLRVYECKSCGEKINVGINRVFTTIEMLKEKGCPVCNGSVFDMSSKAEVK